MTASFTSRLALSRSGLDRDHLTRRGGVDALLADASTRAVVLHDGRALLAAPDRLALPPAGGVPHTLALYLGRASASEADATPDSADDVPAADDLAPGTAVLALVLDDEQADAVTGADGDPAWGDQWGDLRRIGARLGSRDSGIFTQALALANWHRSYGFSPRTGTATTVGASGWTRVDPDGKEVFPRTDAAIIVGITDDDDRLLLGSNALWDADRFSLLAGFVEPGESLEAAVLREVHEESGLRVVDPVYLGSQPWPFPASLMVGFRARLAAGEDPAGSPDGEEILALRWFSRDDIREAVAADTVKLPGPSSIARAIIEDWFGGPIGDEREW